MDNAADFVESLIVATELGKLTWTSFEEKLNTRWAARYGCFLESDGTFRVYDSIEFLLRGRSPELFQVASTRCLLNNNLQAAKDSLQTLIEAGGTDYSCQRCHEQPATVPGFYTSNDGAAYVKGDQPTLCKTCADEVIV